MKTLHLHIDNVSHSYQIFDHSAEGQCMCKMRCNLPWCTKYKSNLSQAWHLSCWAVLACIFLMRYNMMSAVNIPFTLPITKKPRERSRTLVIFMHAVPGSINVCVAQITKLAKDPPRTNRLAGRMLHVSHRSKLCQPTSIKYHSSHLVVKEVWYVINAYGPMMQLSDWWRSCNSEVKLVKMIETEIDDRLIWLIWLIWLLWLSLINTLFGITYSILRDGEVSYPLKSLIAGSSCLKDCLCFLIDHSRFSVLYWSWSLYFHISLSWWAVYQILPCVNNMNPLV